VYDSTLAREQLGWRPRYDFAHAIERLRAGEDPRSPLAQAIGIKGYHGDDYADGRYPVERKSPETC
jgi:UDP-glucose 4-epimerase